MTNLFAGATIVVCSLSPETQDEIARAMLHLAQGGGQPEEIPPEDLSAVLEGLAQAKTGKFATDDQIEAAFRRFES